MITYEARRGHKPLSFYDSPLDRKFNQKLAEQLRNYAIESVGIGADPAWLEEAWQAAVEICRKMETFTTDDIWALLHLRGIPEPREPRAIGAIMRQVEDTEYAEPTNLTRKSIRIACHSRPLRVWRSNISETEK